MRRILVVDDQVDAFTDAFRVMLPDDHLLLARCGSEALEVLASGERVDAVVLDVRMPAEFARSDEEEGLAVLGKLLEEEPGLPVILLSVISDVDTIVRGMRLGAFYYVKKPPEAGKLRHLLDRAVEQRRAAAEGRSLREAIETRDSLTSGPDPEADRLGSLVGGSPAMRELYGRIQRAAPTGARVLVLGESGTGKELVAREIHRLSPRASRPFRAVNCPGLTKDLALSELFGHRKGSFTGATEDRAGVFVEADGGTVFLDEVGDLDPEVQAKLLRFLQEGEVPAIGAGEPARVDVRVIAATNRDLRAEVAAGRFREDLYYRLNVLPIRTPPLAARREDIPLLARELIGRSAAGGQAPPRISPAVMEKLEAHDWPGNVRELGNTLERAAAMADGGAIGAEHIEIEERIRAEAPDPVEATFQDALAGRPPPGGIVDFRNEHGETALREVILRALRWKGSVKDAGRLLGWVGAGPAAEGYANFRQWMRTLTVTLRTALRGDVDRA